jgi:hypothetical protein
MRHDAHAGRAAGWPAVFGGRAGRIGGQAMIEYVVIAGMLLGTVAIMAVFLYTFREYGDRVLSLVASEYP